MTAHPYMPNSTPSSCTGSCSTRSVSPTSRRSSPRSRPRTASQGALDLPPALASEASLRRHLLDLLARNETCEQQSQLPRRRHLAAPRAGDLRRDRAPQRVPDAGLGHAVLRPRPQPGLVRVREPARRADRDGLRRPARSTAGAAPRGTRSGWPRASPAAATCSCPRRSSPERLAVIRTYCGAARAGRPHRGRARRRTTPTTGGLDLDDLRAKLSARTAAVLFENPGFLGAIEPNAAEIAALARAAGAETIVGVDPISLGVARAARPSYGADIVVGSDAAARRPHVLRRRRGRLHRHPRRGALRARVPDAQPQHRAETVEGEHGFGDRALRADVVRLARGRQRLDRQLRLPLGGRERRLHGADGAARASRELGRADPRAQPLRRPAPRPSSTACASCSRDGFFKEFVVDFDETGRTVAEVNRGASRAAGSSAARTSRATSRSSDRARSTASPRCTAAPTSTGSSAALEEVLAMTACALPRGRLGRAARDGDGPAGPPRRRLRRRRARGRRTPSATRTSSCPRRCAANAPPELPELSEPEVLRHYLHLSQETLGMMGVSLFGTCTMKYNPRLANELVARARDRGAAPGTRTTRRCRACSSSSTGST